MNLSVLDNNFIECLYLWNIKDDSEFKEEIFINDISKDLDD